MKAVYIAIAIILLVGGTALFFINNLSVQPTTEVEQNIETTSPVISKTVREGEFIRIDAAHSASGQVFISEENQLVFSEDFNVVRGPDLFVYLTTQSVEESGELGEFVSLGKINSFSGGQQYNLPENSEDYTHVVIWCRAFGVLFSEAQLAQT